MGEVKIRVALTYDDVLLVPKKSSVKSRSDVSLTTKLTRNITLNNPIVSSDMDTVTEASMAIEMARNGGVGILHRFLSVEEQVLMVEKVKRAESHRIEHPW
jgi:IMP dehydrogenase